jgi:hypothetical protein
LEARFDCGHWRSIARLAEVKSVFADVRRFSAIRLGGPSLIFFGHAQEFGARSWAYRFARLPRTHTGKLHQFIIIRHETSPGAAAGSQHLKLLFSTLSQSRWTAKSSRIARAATRPASSPEHPRHGRNEGSSRTVISHHAFAGLATGTRQAGAAECLRCRRGRREEIRCYLGGKLR